MRMRSIYTHVATFDPAPVYREIDRWSIIGRGYKELELSQVMIPPDRPYVGLLVIKIFPAYLLPGRSEALTKTTSEDA